MRMFQFMFGINIFVRTLSFRGHLINGNRNRLFQYVLKSNVPTFSDRNFQTVIKAVDKTSINVQFDQNVQKLLQPNQYRKAKVKVCVDETLTIDNLLSLIKDKFPAFKKIPFKLKYVVDGEFESPRIFQNDNDLKHLLSESCEAHPLKLFVQSASDNINGATMATYIRDMPDPDKTPSYTMVSFYRFHEINSTDLMTKTLFDLWKPFKVLGRVYIANEGINAQMAIPTNILPYFKKTNNKIPLLKDMYYNTDEKVLSIKDFYDITPFKTLHIRVKKQIVTDGFEEPLDWSINGNYLNPLDFHQALDQKEAVILDCRNIYESDIGTFENAIPLNTVRFQDSWSVLEEILANKPKDTPLLTYCTGGIRCVKVNAYLIQKLKFENVSSVRGGIIAYARSVKELQENKVEPSRNSGSASTLRSIESKFKGLNYVFDDRVITEISPEETANCCETCGAACNIFLNCANHKCAVRFLQCSKCSGRYSKCCSLACQQEWHEAEALKDPSVVKELSIRRKIAQQAQQLTSRNKPLTEASGNLLKAPAVERNLQEQENNVQSQYHENLANYCEQMSTPEPELLQQLTIETQRAFPAAANMLSGHLQGRLMSLISSLHRPNKILEIGTFTGYSALCLAEGLIPLSKSTSANNMQSDRKSDDMTSMIRKNVIEVLSQYHQSTDKRGLLVSVDKDLTSMKIAEKYILQSPLKDKISLVHERARDALHKIIKASSERESNVLMHQVDEEDVDQYLFDVIFIDADKKYCLEYLQLILGEISVAGDADVTKDGNDGSESKQSSTFTSRIIRENGLVIIDNTLWKGHVLSKLEESDDDKKTFLENQSTSSSQNRTNDITTAFHNLNTYCKNHPNLHPIMLPIRDGLTVMTFNTS